MLTPTKLAKLAHVSVSTASKAFSMSSEVNEQTREEIFRIAREHGCFKKFYNAKYPRLVVALVCPEFRGRYYSRMVARLQELFADAGCEVCVASTRFSGENKKELLNYYHDYSNVDGILTIDGGNVIDKKYEIPIVALSCDQKRGADASVTFGLEQAIEQIADHFCSAGVRKIGYLGEKYTGNKEDILRTALERRGIGQMQVFSVESRFEKGGYEGMEQILALPAQERPRAVVCGYDHLAVGAIKCAYDHGLSVPGDIAIVGMDDVPEAEYLIPTLASVDIHMEEVCRAAVETMMELLNGRPVEQEQTIPASFVLRDSAKV